MVSTDIAHMQFLPRSMLILLDEATNDENSPEERNSRETGGERMSDFSG